jgi:hypothetical protein
MPASRKLDRQHPPAIRIWLLPPGTWTRSCWPIFPNCCPRLWHNLRKPQRLEHRHRGHDGSRAAVGKGLALWRCPQYPGRTGWGPYCSAWYPASASVYQRPAACWSRNTAISLFGKIQQVQGSIVLLQQSPRLSCSQPTVVSDPGKTESCSPKPTPKSQAWVRQAPL